MIIQWTKVYETLVLPLKFQQNRSLIDTRNFLVTELIMFLKKMKVFPSASELIPHIMKPYRHVKMMNRNKALKSIQAEWKTKITMRIKWELKIFNQTSFMDKSFLKKKLKLGGQVLIKRNLKRRFFPTWCLRHSYY